MTFIDKSIDPKEIEAMKHDINYVDISHHQSLDYDEYETNEACGFTEKDTLESYHQTKADFEKLQQERYLTRLNILRDANRKGVVKRVLTDKQYEIFQLTFEYNKNVTEISNLLKVNHATISKALSRIVTRLQKYFRKTGYLSLPEEE